MRQHRSVFMLFVRSSIYPVLGLMSVMSVLQIVLFRLAMESGLYQNLEDTIAGSKIHFVLYVAFWILMGWENWMDTTSSSQVDYTWKRLRVPEWTVPVWRSVCSGMWFLSLWLMEGLLVLGLCSWYLSVREVESAQALLLACYRSEFLHSLIPMREWTRWARNLALVVGFGVTTGGCVGKPDKVQIVLSVTCGVVGSTMFLAPMGSNAQDALLTTFALIMAFISVIRWSVRREEPEYEET